MLYQWERTLEFAKKQATEVWFVGTSMAVNVTSVLLSIARERRLPVHAINPTEEFVGAQGSEHIRAHAEVWLPEYVKSLGAMHSN